MSATAPAAPPVMPAAHPDVPTVPIYRLSVAQYEAMGQHGILGPEDRVELIHGWLMPKMTKHSPHAVATGLLMDAIPPRVPGGWHLRVQDPVRLQDSVPEPDGALARGLRRDYDEARGHPGGDDVGLVIEVSDTSLASDRSVKGPIYAAGRIPTYWVVNLIDNLVEVYTNPSGPAERPAYASRRDYLPGEEVPLVLDGQEVARIPVRELLP